MNPRRIRNRTAFGFESLEIRNAPSHFGVLAHAAAALHAVHAAAHVRHITDSEVNHKKELQGDQLVGRLEPGHQQRSEQ